MKIGDIVPAHDLVIVLNNLKRDYECFMAGDRLGDAGHARIEFGGIQIETARRRPQFGNPAKQALWEEISSAVSTTIHHYYTERIRIATDALVDLGVDVDARGSEASQ